MKPAAHRRPGLVALVYAYRALAALLVALPFAALLGGPTSSYPRGSSELLDPGGVMLLEALRLTRRTLPAIGWSAGSLAVVVALAGVLPLGALLAGLGREGRLERGFLIERAWSSAGTLALVYLLGLLAQAGAAALVVVIGGKLIDAASLATRTEDLAFVGVFALALLAAVALGVLRDLASVAAVRGGHGLYVATSRALRCARAAGGRALLAWAWRAFLGASALVAAACLAPALATASAVGVALGVVLHQIGVAADTFARASWLAAAMRLHDGLEPQERAECA